MEIVAYLVVGIVAGAAMGFFGIAGGVVIIPGLMFLAGFTQKMASGTNLAILLIPAALGGAIQYYQAGNVNIKAAIIIGAVMSLVAFLTSKIAIRLDAGILRLSFGIFVVIMGVYIVITTKLH